MLLHRARATRSASAYVGTTAEVMMNALAMWAARRSPPIVPWAKNGAISSGYTWSSDETSS
jgi:hypothetical protein